jgi:copper oxidase (laccase) domain-containing protein
VVDEPGAHAGARGDAAVTTVAGAALCITVADCAPVALLGDGAVGVVHAGWRGLAAGVLGAAVDALHRLGATTLRAVVGPCIEPSCYEFGVEDLGALTATLGPEVAGRTRQGTPALDLVAGVRAALLAAGVRQCDVSGICTACSPEHWSHRTRATTSRQALVATLAP